MRFEGDSRGPGRVIIRKKAVDWPGVNSAVPGGRTTAHNTTAMHPFSPRIMQRRMAQPAARATATRYALGIFGPQDKKPTSRGRGR